MGLVLCEICLTSADNALLKQRDLSAFYALNPSWFEGTKDVYALLCAFCWKRISQCIYFINTAIHSRHVLTEFQSGSLLAGLLGGLKPTCLHPYRVRVLPHLDIADDPLKTKLNYFGLSPESVSECGERTTYDDKTMAVQLPEVTQPFLSASLPLFPAHQPFPNSPHSSNTNSAAKSILVYTPSGYTLASDPCSLMEPKEECVENLAEKRIKQEPEFVEAEIEITVQEMKDEPVEMVVSPKFNASVARNATTSSGRTRKGQKDPFDSSNDPRLKWVEMSQEDMLLGREESRKKKRFINRQYKCESCVMGFVIEDKYHQHLKLHDKDRGSFECPVCRVRFVTLADQQTHTKKHYMAYACSKCGLRGADRKAMICHYEESHQDDIYSCGICDARFRSRRMWRDHIENVHYKTRECQVCGKVLANRAGLKTHMKTHDESSGSECSICHKKIRNLDQHMRTHDSVDPDAYCAECDIRFKNILHYNSHLKYSAKHTSPEFECAHCGKKCNTKNYLKSHIFTMHFKTLLCCPHCSKQVVGARRLRNHIRKVHDLIPQVKDKVCHICTHAFATNSQLTNHMRRHTGERPFQCQTCGDKFGYKAALYTHNKLKHLKFKKDESSSAHM